MEYLEKVPMEVNQIKTGETEKRIITDDEFKKVLRMEPNTVLQAYYRLAYSCGLRRCEMNDSEYVIIDGQDYLRITTTKGKKPMRFVPINDKTLVKDWQMVKAHQYSKGRVTKGFTKAAKAAGVYVPYKKTLHGNRHSFATYWAKRGDNMMMLKKVMGHSSLKTTEQYADADYLFYVSNTKTGASA